MYKLETTVSLWITNRNNLLICFLSVSSPKGSDQFGSTFHEMLILVSNLDTISGSCTWTVSFFKGWTRLCIMMECILVTLAGFGCVQRWVSIWASETLVSEEEHSITHLVRRAFHRLGRKSIINSLNDTGVWRTAPAATHLLNTKYVGSKIQFSK